MGLLSGTRSPSTWCLPRFSPRWGAHASFGGSGCSSPSVGQHAKGIRVETTLQGSSLQQLENAAFKGPSPYPGSVRQKTVQIAECPSHARVSSHLLGPSVSSLVKLSCWWKVEVCLHTWNSSGQVAATCHSYTMVMLTCAPMRSHSLGKRGREHPKHMFPQTYYVGAHCGWLGNQRLGAGQSQLLCPRTQKCSHCLETFQR